MNMMFKVKPMNKLLERTYVNMMFKIKPVNKLLERSEHDDPE